MPLEDGRPDAVPRRAEPHRQEVLGVAVEARPGEACHQILTPLQHDEQQVNLRNGSGMQQRVKKK
jgi:hypothetical protein